MTGKDKSWNAAGKKNANFYSLLGNNTPSVCKRTLLVSIRCPPGQQFGQPHNLFDLYQYSNFLGMLYSKKNHTSYDQKICTGDRFFYVIFRVSPNNATECFKRYDSGVTIF